MLAGFPPGPFQPALICEINTESGNADAGSESGSAKAVLLFLGAAGKRRNLLEDTCPDLPCCPEGLCRLLVLDLSPRRSGLKELNLHYLEHNDALEMQNKHCLPIALCTSKPSA